MLKCILGLTTVLGQLLYNGLLSNFELIVRLISITRSISESENLVFVVNRSKVLTDPLKDLQLETAKEQIVRLAKGSYDCVRRPQYLRDLSWLFLPCQCLEKLVTELFTYLSTSVY